MTVPRPPRVGHHGVSASGWLQPIETKLTAMTGAGTARELRRPQLGTAIRVVAAWVVGGLIAYLLVPQLVTAFRDWGRLASPVWAWIGVAGGAMVLTHVMGAVVLTGSTLAPLSYPKTVAVQFMVSFTNRLAPSGLGGMATTAWYLRRRGADRSAATAAVALVSSVGFVVHLAAIGVALGWAGSAPMERLRLPVWWPIAVAAVAVLAAAVVWGCWRHRPTILFARIRAVVGHFVLIVASPRHLSMLVGGSAGVTASYVLAFWASLQAFGVRISAANVLFAFLGASVIAAATPTPGGMGAAEAALITVTTGLVGQTRPVVDAVLAYRLITYWFPVLPGAAAFVYLRRRTGSSTAPEGTAPTGGPTAYCERAGRSEEATQSWLPAGG